MKRFLFAALTAASLLFTGCQAQEANAANKPTANGPAANEPAGTELTIAAYLRDGYLDYAAQEYMKQHRDVKVTVNLYTSEEERDLTKYQQTLNTAMMSGGGEDIIDVSKLNWTRLAEKEMLLDLNEGLALDDENYYMNILDGFLYNGKRAALPMVFVPQGFQINKTGAAAGEALTELTLDNLRNLAEKYPGVALFSGGGSGMSAENLASQIFFRGMDTFMEGGQFEEVLNTIKTIADLVGNADARLDRIDVNAPYLIEQYDVYTPAMTTNGTVDLTGIIPLTYDGNVCYSSNSFIASVNANTKNAALAYDFLQFMVSDQMMMSPELLFCTVNKNVVAEKAKLIYESVAAEGYAPEGFTEESLTDNVRFFNELVSKANVREHYDANIYEFLYEDLNAFFQGNTSAAEACDSLRSKIGMYLNE